MTTYYVATSGSASGNGSASSPFKSINQALQSKIQPGDELVVKAGTYKEQVIISKDGSAAGYVTVRSEVPGGAKIVAPDGKSGIIVVGDYVKVDGFDVSGATTGGITTSRVHHVEITNNTVHDGLGNGISVNQSEFILVEGNTTYRNASDGARSGISIFHAENVSGDTTTEGYRIVVRGNVSYDNVTKTGARTDGNGIIIDSLSSPKDTYKAYTYPTLVENNVVYNNGGAGVQLAWSDNVTVRNNTSWHNSLSKTDSTWKGELSNMNSSHNTWVNNIAVADPSNPYATAIANVSYKATPNLDIVYASNLTYNDVAGASSLNVSSGNQKPAAADNLLGVDPGFVNAATKDFRISDTSKAVDAGTAAHGITEIDLTGHARTGAIDLGAYETKASTGTGTGTDSTIIGTEAADKLNGGTANDKLLGHGGNDTLSGGDGNDSLHGGDGNDHLDAGKGADLLNGGYGNDILIGGLGQDTLTGWKGADTFVFSSVADAGNGATCDVINDCWRVEGDRIDLSQIDASTKVSGNQAFAFIADKAFSGPAGQLRYSGGVISGDVDGDKAADFQIKISDGHWLGAADFIL